MRKTFLFPALLALLVLLSGCRSQPQPAQIAATTLPVYEFTSRICVDTPLTVTRLVTESVSCLHDYSLNVRQVKAAEAEENDMAEIDEYISEFCGKFGIDKDEVINSRFYVLTPDTKNPYKQLYTAN